MPGQFCAERDSKLSPPAMTQTMLVQLPAHDPKHHWKNYHPWPAKQSLEHPYHAAREITKVVILEVVILDVAISELPKFELTKVRIQPTFQELRYPAE